MIHMISERLALSCGCIPGLSVKFPGSCTETVTTRRYPDSRSSHSTLWKKRSHTVHSIKNTSISSQCLSWYLYISCPIICECLNISSKTVSTLHLYHQIQHFMIYVNTCILSGIIYDSFNIHCNDHYIQRPSIW